MASGGVKKETEGALEWKKIKEEMTCSICGDLFTDPKTIPCLHTFCKVCLEKSIEMNKRLASEVCCPLCRAKLPQDDVDLIPTNFTTNHLVEIYAERRKVVVDHEMLTGTGCGKCKEDSPAIMWCDECETLLCYDCNEIHRKWSEFKSHKAVSVEVFIQLGSEMGSGTTSCNNHDRPLNLFCKICDSVVCHVCILEDHCKHSFVIAKRSVLNEMRTTSPEHTYTEVKPKSTVCTSEVKLQPTPLPEQILPKTTCSSSNNHDDFADGTASSSSCQYPEPNSTNLEDTQTHLTSTKNKHGLSENKTPSDPRRSDICKDHAKPLTAYCMSCNVLICQECIMTDHSKHDFALSVMNTVDSTDDKPTSNGNQNFPQYWLDHSHSEGLDSKVCKDHAKPLNLHCITCDCMICQECISGLHYKHDFMVSVVNEPKDVKQHKTKRGFSFKNLMTGFSHRSLTFSDSRTAVAAHDQHQIPQQQSNSMDVKLAASSKPDGKTKSKNKKFNKGTSDPQLVEHSYPLYVGKHNYSARTTDDLSFKKGDLLFVIRADDDGWWLARCKESTKEGYVPSGYIVEFKSPLSAEEWYFGTVRNKHVDELLMQAPNDHGSFLVCDSKNTSSGYSLVVRDGITIKRWKINKSSDKYFVNASMTFESLPQLVAYHTKHTGKFLFEIMKTPCIPTEVQQTAGLSKATNKVWEIQKSSLTLYKKIDTGNFGEVWEAVWNNTTPVIVNTLNPGTVTVSDFLKEATVMKQLRHRNVVQLYAVCVEEEPIYVVTEPTEHGNLLDYLRGDGRTLQLPQLINMGAQVAAGMAYLEQNTYTHGNLAARSVFVSEHLICRVGDFGILNTLSKETSEELIRSKSKWSAPEVLKFSHVTTKSDVWSFGVLLYEVVTYGRIPYPGMSDCRVQEKLQTGYHMPCPTSCPEQLHKIMMKCWNSDAVCRPTFETLQWQLEEFFIDDVLYEATVATPYLPQ
ncbi:proto-oncogene tyrosine-protein kinase Src-like isoform X2 [Dysidea avara]|uniref:proto-oncogene tyrosine-protein kinase Src-like isoform X2 n=1 Tax=Dysidea avara TaxID=196820 RepID=UPI00332BB17E